MSKEWLWVEPATAAALASAKDVHTEVLRKGHGLLELQPYADLLATGELRIILFRNKTAALVTLGPSVEGTVMNILTVEGDIKRCEEAIKYLEDAAREAEVSVVVSVGHAGWARVMRRQGYQIEPRLFMKKVLQ